MAARRDGTADEFWTHGLPPEFLNAVPSLPDWDDFEESHILGQHLDNSIMDGNACLLNSSEA
eukprot:6203279-Pyramimonas_sp.AAC.1